jgi:hypothetical protein
VVASNAAAPAAIAPSALPPAAAASLQGLQVAQVGLPAGGGAAGGAAATAGTGGGVGFGVPAALVAVGLGAALIANESGKDNPVATTTHH